MKVPEVSIVVLNWNGTNDTLACLAFLQACALIFRGRTNKETTLSAHPVETEYV